MQQPSDIDQLLTTVVSGGFCIGCGACAALDRSPLRMEFDALGRLRPMLRDDLADGDGAGVDVRRVCPFSDQAATEDQLTDEQFADAPHRDDRLGAWRRLYAGHVVEDGYRDRGASGGLGGWVVAELLRSGAVDAVVHVEATAAPGQLFGYRVSRTLEEVHGGSHSAYHPVEMSEALREARERPGRYAIVGVPCFIKAVRLLARSDAIIAQRISHTVALFSGHLKSTGYAEYLGWQVGIAPGQLRSIDFRTKLPPGPANQYAMTVVGADGPITRPMHDLHGHDWGMGLFKLPACDVCDDIAGETADVSIGDAWLPGYVRDPRGTNILVIRDERLVPLFEEALAQGRLALTPITPDDVVRSQTGAFRHRRELLPDRLAALDEAAAWRPPKRLAAKPGTPLERAQNTLRASIRDGSAAALIEARDAGRVELVQERLADVIADYERVREQAAHQRRAAARETPKPPTTGRLSAVRRRLGLG